jgi:hypothetical protein
LILKTAGIGRARQCEVEAPGFDFADGVPSLLIAGDEQDIVSLFFGAFLRHITFSFFRWRRNWPMKWDEPGAKTRIPRPLLSYWCFNAFSLEIL